MNPPDRLLAPRNSDIVLAFANPKNKTQELKICADSELLRKTFESPRAKAMLGDDPNDLPQEPVHPDVECDEDDSDVETDSTLFPESERRESRGSPLVGPRNI